MATFLLQNGAGKHKHEYRSKTYSHGVSISKLKQPT